MKRIVGLIVLVSLAVVACNKTPQEIRIGYLPIAANAPLFVGLDGGYYTRAGLTCTTTPFQSSVDAIYALQRGDVDVLFAPPLNNVADALTKAPGSFRIAAIHGNDRMHYFEAFLVPAESNLDSLQTMKSATLGCFPGTFAERIAVAILKKMAPNMRVTVKKLEFAAQLGALEGGSVDLLFAYEPLIATATSKGLGRVVMAGPIVQTFFEPFPVSAVCVSSAFIASRPRVAEQFMRAHSLVMDAVAKNPEATVSVIAKYAKVDSAIAAQVHQCYFSPLTPDQKTATVRALQLFKDLGIIESIPDTGSLFYEPPRGKTD